MSFLLHLYPHIAQCGKFESIIVNPTTLLLPSSLPTTALPTQFLLFPYPFTLLTYLSIVLLTEYMYPTAVTHALHA